MPIVCGIKFRGTGKVYYFSPEGLQDLAVNDHVIVETARGVEMGQVAMATQEVPADKVVGQLKPVMRKASTSDLLDAQRFRTKEVEALEQCREQVARANLPMKLVQAEYNYDGTRLTFFFTSEQRVDFRDLVRELAHVFKTRIELRQIGVRDEAKIVGGVGKCGRSLCCATWLNEFAPVSIRMAKQQDLPLSPMEISGLCGRLLCCLAYETEFYKEVKGKFPKVGKMIDTPAGPARIVKIRVFKEIAEAELEDGTRLELTADQVSGKEPIVVEPRPAGLNGFQQRALGRLVDNGGQDSDAADEDDALDEPDVRDRREPPSRRNDPAPAPASAPTPSSPRDAGQANEASQNRRSRRPRPSQPRRDQSAGQAPPASAPAREQPVAGQGQAPSSQGQNRSWSRKRRRPPQGGQPNSGNSAPGDGA